MMTKRPPERRLRVYQQWQGNERFFCYGHCVTGPSWKSGLGSLVLLLGPTVIFLVFVAPYMSARLSPAILVVSCLLPVFCVSMLLMTSCRDPGILPRQEPDEEWLQGRKPRAKDVCVNGHRVTVRYNDTCHFYQPPRAHHCSVNDNCIERFDHHCPWVGTTIGKRNYRTFLLFIYGTSVYIAWTFGVSIGSLFVRHSELVRQQQQIAGAALDQGGSGNLWLTTLSQSGAALALMVFTFIFFWFVCGLSGFHTWLVATNQTTYENFRYNHNQVPNPYNEGLFKNCASVWLKPIPPSKVQFRAYLDEVVVQPVEMGFSEWGTSCTAPAAAMAVAAAAAAAPINGAQRAEQTGEAPIAAAAAINPSNDNNPWVLGQGEGTAVAVQVDDSVTEAPSLVPISRSPGQSHQTFRANSPGQAAMAAAGTAAGTAAAAAAAAQPHDAGFSSGGGLEAEEGLALSMQGRRGSVAGSAVGPPAAVNSSGYGDSTARGASDDYIFIEMAHVPKSWEESSDLHQQQQQHSFADGSRGTQASDYQEVQAWDSLSGGAEDNGVAFSSNGDAAPAAGGGSTVPTEARPESSRNGWRWMRGSNRDGQ